MNYPEAVAYLDSLAQFGWKLDLERIERLCELAGHPERQFRSILVGGSAGKGSTCAFFASILQAAGFRTGTAPKPHLHTHRERAQVDGELISEAEFAALMGQIVPLAEQVTAEAGSPTVFEVMTLLAFLYFARSGAEWAVVEVGLGGRFDATNVLVPDLAAITMIGLDHTDRLGETVEEIAFEKAGIIKPGRRLVTGATGSALEVIVAIAREREADTWRLGQEIVLTHVETDLAGTTFDVQTPAGSLEGLRSSLVGEHQARNAALAAGGALWLLQAELGDARAREAVRSGISATRIEGRLQAVQSKPLVVVDAAHSPDRVEALLATLGELYLPAIPGRRLILVVGCSRGHAPEEVVRRLAPHATVLIATRSRHFAAVPPEEIASTATGSLARVEVVEPVGEALRTALSHAGPADLVLVTGSLFVAAEALESLGAGQS